MLYPSQGDLIARVRELEDRVRQLESAKRLGDAVLDQGAMIAVDDTGAERARFGQLGNEFVIRAEQMIVTDGTGAESRLDVVALGRKTGFFTGSTLVNGTSTLWTTVMGPEVTVRTTSGQIQLASVVTLSEITYDSVVISTEIRDSSSLAQVVAPSTVAGNGTSTALALAPIGTPTPVAGFWTLPPGQYRVRHRFALPSSFSARLNAVVMNVNPT